MSVEVPYKVCPNCRSLNGPSRWTCQYCGVSLNGN